jgi:arylsulfatase A-like enzyme
MTSRLPNVILIMVDTLRADRLSCYGYRRLTSPRLDAFAEESVLYAAAISPGVWTPPSHASIFTGTYPSRHGVDRTHPYIDAPLTVLPEYLQQHGYRTFGVSSSYWIDTATRFDRGFDVFRQSWQLLQTGANPPLERQRRRDPGYRGPSAPRGVGEGLRSAANRVDVAFWRRCCQPIMAVDKGAGRVNRIVRRWIRQWATMDEPVFAFIHYMEPHLPYRPPAWSRHRHLGARAEARARTVNQHAPKFISGRARMSPEDLEILGHLYDAEVSYTDDCIGDILDGLRASRLLERSIVIVTSDHGENLGEHGLMDHMFSVHEPVVHVPLIIRFPAQAFRGIEGGLVQTHDIFPTVVAMLEDGSSTSGNGRNGRNGRHGIDRSQFQGGPLPPFGVPRDFAVTELNDIQPPIPTLANRYPYFDWTVYDRRLRAVRTLTHKYIRASTGAEELYAVVDDPGELRNLAATEHSRAAQLRAWLDTWEANIGPARARPGDRAPGASGGRSVHAPGGVQG